MATAQDRLFLENVKKWVRPDLEVLRWFALSAKIWLNRSMENDSVPPEQDKSHAEITRRRRRLQSEKMERGNLSVTFQIGIIVGAFGIAFLVLYGFLYLASQPLPNPPVDQAVIDSGH